MNSNVLLQLREAQTQVEELQNQNKHLTTRLDRIKQSRTALGIQWSVLPPPPRIPCPYTPHPPPPPPPCLTDILRHPPSSPHHFAFLLDWCFPLLTGQLGEAYHPCWIERLLQRALGDSNRPARTASGFRLWMHATCLRMGHGYGSDHWRWAHSGMTWPVLLVWRFFFFPRSCVCVCMLSYPSSLCLPTSPPPLQSACIVSCTVLSMGRSKHFWVVDETKCEKWGILEARMEPWFPVYCWYICLRLSHWAVGVCLKETLWTFTKLLVWCEYRTAVFGLMKFKFNRYWIAKLEQHPLFFLFFLFYLTWPLPIPSMLFLLVVPLECEDEYVNRIILEW